MVISATQKYPREGAVAGKWYNMEIRSDLKSGGYATVYVNGQIAGKIALTANTAAPYLMIQPVRNGFGNSAEVNIDNIICTALTALEKEINDAADAITLFEGTVYDDIALPSTVGDSISVTWASDDESVITNNGKIVTANPDTAMMTATFTKGGETVVRSYRVNTGAKNALELASV